MLMIKVRNREGDAIACSDLLHRRRLVISSLGMCSSTMVIRSALPGTSCAGGRAAIVLLCRCDGVMITICASSGYALSPEPQVEGW